MRNYLILLLIISTFPIKAATLHLGPSGSGHPYSTLQSAWNASQNNDEIIVHAGTYSANASGYCLVTNSDNIARTNITIRAAGDGRATFLGTLLFNTVAGQTCGNYIVEGLYINPLGTFKTGIYVSPISLLSRCTFRYNVIYGDFTGGYGIYLYGLLANHGQHIFEHNTVYSINQTGSGIYNRIEGTQDTLTAPVFNGNIVVNCDTGVKAWYLGMKYNYGACFGSKTANFSSTQIKGIGLIEQDPIFESTDPVSINFLYLSQDTLAAILTGAHDGTYMGALPQVPLTLTCGDWGFFISDLNKDCQTNFQDLLLFSEHWLDCTAVIDCD